MAAPLWPLRDDRTLSAYAKLAYVMLWTRQPDVRPSMKTLAADMSVALSTAHKAVRELQRAGLVKVLLRVTPEGDPDCNQFELTPLREAGYPHTPDGGGVIREAHPKNGTTSTEVKGDKSRASWRARPAVTREQAIDFVREAVAQSYSQQDADDLYDGQAVALWYLLVGRRNPAKPVAYLCKIFDETPYLDTHLATAGSEEDWELVTVA